MVNARLGMPLSAEMPAMTLATPLVRLGSEGCPGPRPPRKTNPEGRQVARILRRPDQGTQPCAKSDHPEHAK